MSSSPLRSWRHPWRRLRARLEHWIATRTPRVAGPWTLSRRRIYILPTRAGYAYAGLLLVMLLGAMNYSNSMAFATTFLLAGLGLVGLHHTHGNLVNLQLSAAGTAPIFAGERARFRLLLRNPSRRLRCALSVSWSSRDDAASADLAPSESVELSLELPAGARGWLHAPRFTVATRFPMGLFRAWSWAELNQRCLVYPHPAPPGLPPPSASGGSGRRSAARSGLEDFVGLRDYRPGDHLRSIHWKSLPKLGKPLVRQFAETLDDDLWLDWEALPGLPTETRLSQLTRWVLDAEVRGRSYGLRLPGRVMPTGLGAAHCQRCLEALALHGIER